MSVDTTMAVLYAQSGLSTNVANAAMVAPQAALAMTRVLAAEAARQEREQVEKNEKTEEAGIHDKEGSAGSFQSRIRQRRALQRDEEPQELAVTPFVGNLLNVRV